jgi:hypothetical protein
MERRSSLHQSLGVSRAIGASARALRNLTAVASIPENLLPAGPARWSLVALALLGEAISILPQYGDDPWDLTLFVEGLGTVRRDKDGRVRVSEYAPHWRAFYLVLTGRAERVSEAERRWVATRQKGDR